MMEFLEQNFMNQYMAHKELKDNILKQRKEISRIWQAIGSMKEAQQQLLASARGYPAANYFTPCASKANYYTDLYHTGNRHKQRNVHVVISSTPTRP